MKSFLLIIILLSILGCGNSNNELKQIGSTRLFISPYPLKKGKPFTLEARLLPETIKNINHNIENQYGSEMTSTIIDGKKVELKTLRADESYVERIILIKRGDDILYKSKLKLTSINQNTPNFKIDSIGFENSHSLENKNVNIHVEFRRNSRIEQIGSSSTLIFSNSAEVEVKNY